MYFRLVISWPTTGNGRKDKHFSDLKRLRVPEIDSLLQNTIRDARIKKTFHSSLYFLPLTLVFSTAYFSNDRVDSYLVPVTFVPILIYYNGRTVA